MWKSSIVPSLSIVSSSDWVESSTVTLSGACAWASAMRSVSALILSKASMRPSRSGICGNDMLSA